MDSIKETWEAGLQEELDFWKVWLPKYNHIYNADKPLKDYFKDLIGDKKKVSILDVGSGPISLIGYKWPTAEVELTLADYLADKYSLLMMELGISSLHPVDKQDMSHFTYPDNTFDIVHCANALDHSFDPSRAIKEMVRICQPGGVIYLRHHANNGIRRRYSGLHQWNISCTKNGDCLFKSIFWKFLLSDCVDGFINEFEYDKGGKLQNLIISRKWKT